jgi:hypothetical protein
MPPENEIPPIVSEYFMALLFGWTLDYIRFGVSYKDADMLTTLIGTTFRIVGSAKDVRSRAFAAIMGARI